MTPEEERRWREFNEACGRAMRELYVGATVAFLTEFSKLLQQPPPSPQSSVSGERGRG